MSLEIGQKHHEYTNEQADFICGTIDKNFLPLGFLDLIPWQFSMCNSEFIKPQRLVSLK